MMMVKVLRILGEHAAFVRIQLRGDDDRHHR
jgi:hypothetical protein